MKRPGRAPWPEGRQYARSLVKSRWIVDFDPSTGTWDVVLIDSTGQWHTLTSFYGTDKQGETHARAFLQEVTRASVEN